jgi:hypothetical protein
MGRERSMPVETVRALRIGPCLGNRPAGNTAFVAQGQSFSPRHQLFPIEERSAAVAGRSSFLGLQMQLHILLLFKRFRFQRITSSLGS